jgi:dienelactone hydrolase
LATFFVLAFALAWLFRTLVARLLPVELPAATGPYRVRRVSYDREDVTREDPYARKEGVKRELPVWIWYPAAPAAGAEPGAYLPGRWSTAGWIWGFDPNQVRAHALPEVPVAPDRNNYPVLVFSPAGSSPHSYTALFEELASHGYVVADIAHTYEAVPITVFADGRAGLFNPASVGGALRVSTGAHTEDVRKRAAIINVKAADVRFVVDQLEQLDAGTGLLGGRLDLARLGVFGHSLGGGTAAEVCRLDRRCRAGVNLDGGLWREADTVGVTQPFMSMFAEHPEYVQPCTELVSQKAFASAEYCEADRALTIRGWQKLYADARPGYSVVVRGARHTDLIDWALLPLRPWSLAKRSLGRIGGRRMWRTTSDYLLAFFDRHLNCTPAPLLDDPSPDHPEAVLGAPEVLFEAHEPGR